MNTTKLNKIKNYKTNVEDILSEEFLRQETYSIGDELLWLPSEEFEANFCFLNFIKKQNEEGWLISLRIENEFNNDIYNREYFVKKGSYLELNLLQPNFVCFLPPRKLPVLVEIMDITYSSISLKTIGVR